MVIVGCSGGAEDTFVREPTGDGGTIIQHTDTNSQELRMVYPSTIESGAPPTFIIFTGEFKEEILRIGHDGEIYYKGRLLGTDPEIFEVLQKVINGWPKNCPSKPTVNSGFYHVDGEPHHVWHFAVDGVDVGCFKQVKLEDNVYWQEGQDCTLY